MNIRQDTKSVEERLPATQPIPRIFARLKAGRVHSEGSEHRNGRTQTQQPGQCDASGVRPAARPEYQTTSGEFPDES